MNITPELKKQMDKAMGLIELPVRRRTSIQLFNICFKNIAYPKEDIWTFRDVVKVCEPDVAEAYSFIVNHQDLYLSENKMSYEKVSEILYQKSTKYIERQNYSDENKYLLLHAAFLINQIHIILYFIEKNILPSPYHKNLFIKLLENSNAIKVIKALENKGFEFIDDFDGFYLKEALKHKNIPIIEYILNKNNEYFTNKHFAYYLINIKFDDKTGLDKEEIIDKKIAEHIEVMSEFFKVITKESFLDLTSHLKKELPQQDVQGKLEKYFNYIHLDKTLETNNINSQRPKL